MSVSNSNFGGNGTVTAQENTFTATQTFTQPISMQIPSSNQNTTPWNCTAIGYQALAHNTGASNNAFGQGALYNNTSGFLNDALGQHCLYNNSTGTYNVAAGIDTLFNNTTGNNNNAFAIDALFFNTTGSSNNAFGYTASYHNTTGGGNSAFGQSALYSNTIGYGNTAFGQNTLYNYNMTQPFPQAIGNMCAFGNGAGQNYTGTEVNNITIGNNGGIAGESNMLRIGQPNAYNSPTGQIAFSMSGLVGLGTSPIYGLDNRKAVSTADTSAITLYTTTSTTAVYRVSARALSTSGTSATYVISWTENGTTQTQTLTISAVNSEQHNTFLIQPDNATNITVQITSLTSTTLNVACVVEQMA